jgi:hypothetical protein
MCVCVFVFVGLVRMLIREKDTEEGINDVNSSDKESNSEDK